MHLPSFECVMCDRGEVGSAVHLFLQCPFACGCWDLMGLTVPLNCSLNEAVDSFKVGLRVPFFMELIILTSGIAPSINSCAGSFVEVLLLSCLRAKSSLSLVIGLWLDNFKSQFANHVFSSS
ncbi:hypothetical protein BS78_01G061900 [Paspalum vaginatum]|nr:hypothetical protein BS78_01G061900 [Paspalum vaginatum]